METQSTTPQCTLCPWGNLWNQFAVIHSFFHSLFGSETSTWHLLLSKHRAEPRDTMGALKQEEVSDPAGLRLSIYHPANSFPIICTRYHPHPPPPARLLSQTASSRCKVGAAL